MRKLFLGVVLIGTITCTAVGRTVAPLYALTVDEYSVDLQSKKIQYIKSRNLKAPINKPLQLSVLQEPFMREFQVRVSDGVDRLEEYPFWREVSETLSQSVNGTESPDQKISFRIPHYTPMTLFVQPCFDRENLPTFILFGVKEQTVLLETPDRGEATVKLKYHFFRDTDKNDEYRLTRKKIPLDKLAPSVSGIKIRTFENEKQVYFIALKVGAIGMEEGSAKLIHEYENDMLQPEVIAQEDLPVRFDVQYLNALGQETVFSRIGSMDRIEIDAFNQRYTDKNVQGKLIDDSINLTFLAKLFPVSYSGNRLTVELVLFSDIKRYDGDLSLIQMPLRKTIHRMLVFNEQDVIEMKWPTDWSAINERWSDLSAKARKKIIDDLQGALSRQSLIIKPVYDRQP